MRYAFLLMVMVGLAGCGIQLPFGRGGGEPSTTSAAQVPGEDTPRPDARPGETGAAEIGDASGGATGSLGTTLATLGDATMPGLWLETSLVSSRGPGRVTTEAGTSVDLELIPSGGAAGAGGRLSLAAMQALGLPLTAVAEIDVEAL